MEIETQVTKVDAAIKAQEGLIGSEGGFTSRLQDILHTMKGHFRAVSFYLFFTLHSVPYIVAQLGTSRCIRGDKRYPLYYITDMCIDPNNA